MIQLINLRNALISLIITCVCVPTSCVQNILTLSNTKHEHSLSSPFLDLLRETFGAHCFIETGTYLGNTALRASQIFSEVHTIELSETFYHQNLSTFRSCNNIYPYLGESDQILNKILPSIKDKNCIFFLDAHFSACGTALGANGNTPLLSEIRTIGSHSASSIIIIDDIRQCQTQKKINAQQHHDYNETIDGYPSLTQLKQELLKINRNYEFGLFGDMAIAYPKEKFPQIHLSPVVAAMATSRLFDELVIPSAQETADVLRTEQDIMHAQGKEKIAIQQLQIDWKDRGQPFITTHYRLWGALTYLGDHQYGQAIPLLDEVYKFGLNHWRIQWYSAFAHYHAGEKGIAKTLLQSIKGELAETGIKEALQMLKELESHI